VDRCRNSSRFRSEAVTRSRQFLSMLLHPRSLHMHETRILEFLRSRLYNIPVAILIELVRLLNSCYHVSGCSNQNVHFIIISEFMSP